MMMILWAGDISGFYGPGEEQHKKKAHVHTTQSGGTCWGDDSLLMERELCEASFDEETDDAVSVEDELLPPGLLVVHGLIPVLHDAGFCSVVVDRSHWSGLGW